MGSSEVCYGMAGILFQGFFLDKVVDNILYPCGYANTGHCRDAFTTHTGIRTTFDVRTGTQAPQNEWK